ncbi:conserved protein of unknown function [Tenacibaculum jejuense]|uniref:Uncharacterized protein n=2 Tax=Tenacibaculum jejuense TaxID=584609 RepID=A0A238U699_9FLAO|nr:conserved protein of unknown function [Tenacibaculum jejuense]
MQAEASEMKDKITLENVHTFSIPLSEHPLKWKFEDSNNKLSAEFQDQIIALTSDASQFLWNFENTQRYLNSISGIKKYFNKQDELSFSENDNQKVKKWLYEKEIPFDQKVFWVTQPDCGFILTWKMVIKFSDDIFFSSDELIWDKTLNWCLIFNHNDVFYFGKNRNFNADKHSEEINKIQKLINKGGGKAST